MHHYIVLLSDLSYQLGLIGIAEYEERREIAYWLSKDGEAKPDPRSVRHEEAERPHEKDEFFESDDAHGQEGFGSTNVTDDNPSDRRLRFLAFKKWMFTVGDCDCYPSVPHGHLHQKMNDWPKLNPYTGRVFSQLHVEDASCRLTKSEMKQLWRNEGFVAHCRKQVLWYSDFAPNYSFPQARFEKLRFPKW